MAVSRRLLGRQPGTGVRKQEARGVCARTGVGVGSTRQGNAGTCGYAPLDFQQKSTLPTQTAGETWTPPQAKWGGDAWLAVAW